jgi:hypothetical protein
MTVGAVKERQGKKVSGEYAIRPAWDLFHAELDAWRAAGRVAGFWWRDDDAARPGPKLDRLLGLAGTVPLSLAVIPRKVQDSLARRVADHNGHGRSLAILQHGYAHENHAPSTEKKAELGAHRPTGAMLEELERGRARLSALFGPLFAPVLTPPWNRIDGALVARLAAAGLYGLSRFGPRGPGEADSVVNTHIDIVDWHGTRGFVGEAAVLETAVAHLEARRTGLADPEEPTGLLTHHRDHDEDCWRFIGTFLLAVEEHPAAEWATGAPSIGGDPR